AAAGAGWWFFVRVPVHDLPDLTGMQLDGAAAVAAELGYEVEAETADRRDGTTPGEILDQDPPPGVGLAEGETVRLTVSLGNTLTAVPDLANRPEPEARAALEAAGLVAGAATPEHHEE